MTKEQLLQQFGNTLIKRYKATDNQEYHKQDRTLQELQGQILERMEKGE